jgi:hypothetical protein
LYVNNGVSTAETKIARYDNFESGNHTASWVITIPKPTYWASNSFAEAGNYIFVDYYTPPSYTMIFSKTDGSYQGILWAGANIGGPGGVGGSDEDVSVSAYTRTNGEIDILHEEDYQAKNILYRWMPPESPPTISAPTSLTVKPGPEGNLLSWTEPGGVFYNVYRATSQSGPFTTVDLSLAQSNPVLDPGLTDGTQYCYEVQAYTQAGLSPLSAATCGTPSATGFTTYEAENATLGALTGGSAPASKTCTLCSNKKYVTFPTGGTITFKNVNAAGGAGTYPVQLYYTFDGFEGSNSTYFYPNVTIQVNGGTPYLSNAMPYSATASAPTFMVVNLPLNAGATNTIVLSNPLILGTNAPNIDRIAVPSTHN